MLSKLFSLASILGLAAITSAAPLAEAQATSISITPHDQYSSSVGVLGCKIDTNRVAYWPGAVDCNNLCVEVTVGTRKLTLLRIDSSGGAYDVSYDAWNYLYTGFHATERPVAGGGIAATYKEVPMSACSDILHGDTGGKLAFTAANSMNFISSCVNQQGSWVAQHYVLYNIYTPTCTLGKDEVCSPPNWSIGENQPHCPSGISLAKLTSQPVYNILYPSGQRVIAP
jgi:hypothetical protein